MAFAPRPASMLPPGASIRQPGNTVSQQQSSALAARIASKKAELEHLIQLRDMSNGLAGQMEVLQAKLATLKDGTEAVACVLANWDNVLRAITMASTELKMLNQVVEQEVSEENNDDVSARSPLPATLVRIPATQQDKLSGQ
ncbi:DASH complex subunit DAD2 [Aspergillus undulatus]|uniref:DASH complex subunit DAD2 n=1 Tax=Aspergillus undulatus TaxID=1810928 RepID=UPI003CCE2060